MALTLTLISKLCSMMIYILAGFVTVRTGILHAKDNVPFSSLVVWVLQPCLILNAFQLEVTRERLTGFVASLIFSTVIYIVWIILARLLEKPLHLGAIEKTSIIYSNVGNLILPLVSMLLGQEMVFYCSAIQIPFQLFIWTHGLSLVRGEKTIHPARILKNPNVVAMFIGVLCLISGFRFPEIISTSLEGLTAMVAPASMIVIGMVIAGTDLGKVLRFRKAYLILVLRLIVFPLAAYAVLFASGVLRRMPMLAPVFMPTCMALCAPPAGTISQLAVVYNREPTTASIYNLIATLFCVLTLPAMILLYQVIFLP